MNNKNIYDIELFDLTKIYKIRGKHREITALNKINLRVKKGEIFGLLGPNGAGKTTMVSILTTLIQPTEGYANVLGHNILNNPWAIKNKIGLMLGSDMIYNRLTGYNNLKFCCKIYGIKNYDEKIKKIAKFFNLSDWLNQYVEKYSTGMRAKLALARVLLTEPEVLFLDEPMAGLDPISIKDLIEVLLNLNKTIFLTSHQMNVVQNLCQRIAFLKEGNIFKIDSSDNFKKLLQETIKLKIIVKKNTELVFNHLKSLEYVIDNSIANNIIYITIKSDDYLPDLFGILKDYSVSHFNVIEQSLDDVFIQIGT